MEKKGITAGYVSIGEKIVMDKLAKIDNTKTKRILIFICINAVACFVVYMLSKAFPLYVDDYMLQKRYGTNELNKTLSDVVCSTKEWYMNWTGKALSIFLVSALVIVDKQIYNILNAIIHVMFVNTIYLYGRRRKYDYKLLLGVYLFLWLFTPNYGGLVIWLDGSVEYLWMLLPVLFLGYLYYSAFTKDCAHISGPLEILLSVSLFILGCFAGCGLEATGGILILVLALWVYVKTKNKQVIYPRYYCGAVGVIIGYMVLMLAPGNFARAEYVNDIAERSVLIELLFRLTRETYYACRYITPLLGISVCLTILSYCLHKEKVNGKGGFRDRLIDFVKLEHDSVFLMLLSIMSIYIMTFSPAFAIRVLFTPTVLLIISIIISIKRISNVLKMSACNRKHLGVALNIFLAFVSIYVLTQAFTCYSASSRFNEPFIKDVLYSESFNTERFD